MSLDVVRCPLGEEKKCTPSRESLIMEYFGYVHLLTIEEVEDWRGANNDLSPE